MVNLFGAGAQTEVNEWRFLFNRMHKYEYDIIERDMNGRIIALDLKYGNNMIRIMNIYAPNNPIER